MAPRIASRRARRAQVGFAGIALLSLSLAILWTVAGPLVGDTIGDLRAFAFEMAEVALALGVIAAPFSAVLARRAIAALGLAAAGFAVYGAAHVHYEFRQYEWLRLAAIPAILAVAVALPQRLRPAPNADEVAASA
jgi:predicted branched-subunit amino acid permease